MLPPNLGRGPGREPDAGKVGRMDDMCLTADGAMLMSPGGVAKPRKEGSVWSECCGGTAPEACCASAERRGARGSGAAEVVGQLSDDLCM